MILALVRRDLALRLGRWGGVLLPVIFFLLVACLFPFAVGPEPRLLMRIAGGICWVAALLAVVTGLCSGSSSTPVASPIRLVTAAA